jgi:hypothetical protein
VRNRLNESIFGIFFTKIPHQYKALPLFSFDSSDASAAFSAAGLKGQTKNITNISIEKNG